MRTPPRLLPLALSAGVALPLLALGLAGCGGSRPAAPADPLPAAGPSLVAEWDGEDLTLDEFEAAYANSVGGADEAADDSMAALEDFLDRYVNFRLKVRQARDLGLDQDSSLQAEMAEYRDQLARPYFTDQAVLEDIIRDLYEKQQEEIRASHILVMVDAAAPPADTLAAYERTRAFLDSLEAGVPFDDLAFRHSEDPSARRNRGDLGYFTGGRMVEAFEEAAYNTPVGEVAGPLRTRFGYHLIWVQDRRDRTPDIRASHILIRVQGNTPADSAAARETIEGLRERILAGEDFATLARQYSDDVASGRRGGDLGFFGLGRMVPPFNDAAFALQNPGDISDVVETQFGYHLIRLEERASLPTYEEAYPELKRLAEQLPRTTLRRQEIGREERAAAGFTFDSTLVAQALGQFDADSLDLQLRRDGFGDYAGRTFATIGDTAYTFTDFYLWYGRQQPQAATDPRAGVMEQMDLYLAEQGFEYALAQLEERDPAFRALLEQYVDGVLLFKISEDSVWTPAAEDEAGLRAYYEAHRGDYRWPQRHRVLAFTSPSDSLLNAVAADLDAGRPAAEVFAAHEDARLTLRLDTLYLADTTGTPLDVVFDLQPGQHSEVLPERSRLAVYVLDGIEAPREKTFEEARAEVVTNYQDVLEGAWVARLRERYDARVYPERLADAFDGVPAPTPAPDVGAAAPGSGASSQ
ncbi:MAG TPA: peptidylprolyl isomerase [Rubricoccaceae bacterium]|nr:peptidylprolyl isomerase [Rubricoccaceae bacterium]